MTFDKREIEILNAAYQVFVGKTHIFDVVKPPKWENTGIENWVQTELTAGLIDRDYEVSTTGKRKRDCDLIVNKKDWKSDIGIEIKAFTCSYVRGLIDGIRGHPKADLYLYIGQFESDALNQFEDYFKKKGYIKEHRKFDDWMVMLVKKA